MCDYAVYAPCIMSSCSCVWQVHGHNSVNSLMGCTSTLNVKSGQTTVKYVYILPKRLILFSELLIKMHVLYLSHFRLTLVFISGAWRSRQYTTEDCEPIKTNTVLLPHSQRTCSIWIPPCDNGAWKHKIDHPVPFWWCSGNRKIMLGY